ncbi:hypothetical protein B0H63DRAFT_546343 [Podospora didyma]|uniref:Uncharacterized protein n=1 Tax=Podospora didyma TaxID=330526 RepID=A0AAE0NHR9_9PEZI|nr:hypothetical protein B0H63DRAFT_546343 [Podospora didyma]
MKISLPALQLTILVGLASAAPSGIKDRQQTSLDDIAVISMLPAWHMWCPKYQTARCAKEGASCDKRGGNFNRTWQTSFWCRHNCGCRKDTDAGTRIEYPDEHNHPLVDVGSTPKQGATLGPPSREGGNHHLAALPAGTSDASAPPLVPMVEQPAVRPGECPCHKVFGPHEGEHRSEAGKPGDHTCTCKMYLD